jgi:uncharacterized protein involved in exopolysaccharide biosynthesis
MAVEFRQRSAGEILQIFKRRKWHILLPTVAVGVAVGWVVLKLPNLYESKTTLTVKPPTISEKVVASLSEEDISQQLQTINQQVLSRSTLEPMVAKYKLFESEKAAGMPMELIIERMFKNIKTEVTRGDDRKVAGFSITYLDRTPEAARNVAAELANKYVNAQVTEKTLATENTKLFIEKDLADKKNALDTIEQERLQIMTQNVEYLPESAQGLIAQLNGLRQREETLSKQKETFILEKGRAQDSIRMLNNQINITDTLVRKDISDSAARSYTESPAYASMVKERADLTARLAKLKKEYRDKHPDVIDTQTKIDKINDEIEDLKKVEQKRASDAAASGAVKTDIQKKNIELEIQKAQAQIAQYETQIGMKDRELAQNEVLIDGVQAKINAIPQVTVVLEGVENRYKTAKTAYDDILKKYNDAQLQVERDQGAQGETIRVVDPANLPSTPVNATKKPMFALLGLGLGAALGLLIASFLEVPRLLKIQNIEDAKHYTGLPVLASVPPLLTRDELAWKSRSYWFKVFAGIVVALGSIPLIILLLQRTRLLERMVS